MANIQIEWYDTTCTCPDWAKEKHCNGDCERCDYPKLHKHIVSGEYRKFEYDEENGFFKFGSRKIYIDNSDYCFAEWIVSLQIDGITLIPTDSER